MDPTLTPVQRHELHASRGTVIFRQGDLGDSMFVIERGRVRIVFSFRGPAAAPAVLDVERLAEELQVAPPEVHATLAELAAQGAGTLRDGQFVIQGREHVTRLTEALCRLAEEVTD